MQKESEIFFKRFADLIFIKDLIFNKSKTSKKLTKSAGLKGTGIHCIFEINIRTFLFIKNRKDRKIILLSFIINQ